MDEEKKPGIFRDPWRTNAPVAPPKPKAKPEPSAPEISTPVAGEEPIEFEDVKADLRATIMLKGYGGISLAGTDETKKVAVHIINCCVKYERYFEPLLTKYGIVVAKLEGTVNLPMYIKRKDGWTLCIPDARTRDDGLLQLIQALLAIDSNSDLKPYLREFGLSPFKL